MRVGSFLVAAALLAACGASGARELEPAPKPPPPPPEVVKVDARADSIDLAFAGDVMFGRFSKKGFRPIPAEKADVWEHVAPLLDSDFTMVNLETPILRDPPAKSPWGTRMRFVATPARVKSLLSANIDAVTLANNHAYDMHHDGIIETPEVLDELGIRYIGEHRFEAPLFRAVTFDVRGWKVAYIAATTQRNAGQNPKEKGLLPFVDWNKARKTLVPVIEDARAGADLVIVFLHWGNEYDDEPDDWQVKAAHAFVDAGADAVIGAHPHVLQGIERYKDAVIAYSLGNFLFDNLHDATRYHGILHLTFQKEGSCLSAASFHPTVGSHPYFTPLPAKKKQFTAVADRLTSLSADKPLNTTWTIDGDALTAAPACSPPSESP